MHRTMEGLCLLLVLVALAAASPPTLPGDSDITNDTTCQHLTAVTLRNALHRAGYWCELAVYFSNRSLELGSSRLNNTVMCYVGEKGKTPKGPKAMWEYVMLHWGGANTFMAKGRWWLMTFGDDPEVRRPYELQQEERLQRARDAKLLVDYRPVINAWNAEGGRFSRAIIPPRRLYPNVTLDFVPVYIIMDQIVAVPDCTTNTPMQVEPLVVRMYDKFLEERQRLQTLLAYHQRHRGECVDKKVVWDDHISYLKALSVYPTQAHPPAGVHARGYYYPSDTTLAMM